MQAETERLREHNLLDSIVENYKPALDELAQQDLLRVGAPPHITALQGLSRARQANVLRHWLRVAYATTPSAAQLGELLNQLAACTTRGHRIHIKVGRGFVVRSGPQLGWYNPEVLV